MMLIITNVKSEKKKFVRRYGRSDIRYKRGNADDEHTHAEHTTNSRSHRPNAGQARRALHAYVVGPPAEPVLPVVVTAVPWRPLPAAVSAQTIYIVFLRSRYDNNITQRIQPPYRSSRRSTSPLRYCACNYYLVITIVVDRRIIQHRHYPPPNGHR